MQHGLMLFRKESSLSVLGFGRFVQDSNVYSICEREDVHSRSKETVKRIGAKSFLKYNALL